MITTPHAGYETVGLSSFYDGHKEKPQLNLQLHWPGRREMGLIAGLTMVDYGSDQVTFVEDSFVVALGSALLDLKLIISPVVYRSNNEVQAPYS